MLLRRLILRSIEDELGENTILPLESARINETVKLTHSD